MHIPQREGNQRACDTGFLVENAVSVGTCPDACCFMLNIDFLVFANSFQKVYNFWVVRPAMLQNRPFSQLNQPVLLVINAGRIRSMGYIRDKSHVRLQAVTHHTGSVSAYLLLHRVQCHYIDLQILPTLLQVLQYASYHETADPVVQGTAGYNVIREVFVIIAIRNGITDLDHLQGFLPVFRTNIYVYIFPFRLLPAAVLVILQVNSRIPYDARDNTVPAVNKHAFRPGNGRITATQLIDEHVTFIRYVLNNHTDLITVCLKHYSNDIKTCI